MGDAARYRFGVFELDTGTGELRRRGLRVRLHAQPSEVLALLLRRPGEMVTREEISRALWPAGTFVDYEHGVNSAVNRLRDALGDPARSPRFVETIARRGYRFIAPVERLGGPESAVAAELAVVPAELEQDVSEPPKEVTLPADLTIVAGPAATAVQKQEAGVRMGLLDRVLAAEEDLPRTSPAVVRTLFALLQGMYLAFYVGALSNLPEIGELLAELPHGPRLLSGLIGTAALLIPVRIFLLSAVVFRAPAFQARFLRMWPFLLVFDLLWSLAPFLLLHHLSFGLALAATTLLVYSPFAQRSLMLMGAGQK